jgi:hypothetical protein
MLLLLKLGWAPARAATTRTCAGTWTTAAATTTAPGTRARVGLGGHPLLCQPPRFSCAGQSHRWTKRATAACSPGPRATAGSPSAWPRRCVQGGQLHTGCSVLRIAEGRPRRAGGCASTTPRRPVSSAGRRQRCVVALPVFVAARVVQAPHPPSCNSRRPAPALGALAGGQHPPRRAAARPARRRPRMGQRALPGRHPPAAWAMSMPATSA